VVQELEAWLPFELWGPINRRLVLFGQSVCLPRTPKCGECGIKRLCQSSNSSSFKSM
jgi:endonuclease-3